MADLTGVSFSLTSLKNGSTHSVVIQTQTNSGDYFDPTATFTGTWDGQAMTGTLQYDAYDNIHILFSWMGGGGGPAHSFYGTISKGFLGYQIDGVVTVLGSAGGPGHCVGNQPLEIIPWP
jgi:hypothetical protein